MSVDIELEIDPKDVDKLEKKLDEVEENITRRALVAMEEIAQNVARDIQVTFKGGRSPGFRDRTGALRESIKGGVTDEFIGEITGFIGAGDNTIGSDGKPTRDYVHYVEFAEFRGAKDAAFLRPGVMQAQRQILKDFEAALKAEKLV